MEVVWPARGVRRWLIPGLAALALVLVHPLGLIPVYATLASYLVLRLWLDREWPLAELTAAVGVGLFSVPVRRQLAAARGLHVVPVLGAAGYIAVMLLALRAHRLRRDR